MSSFNYLSPFSDSVINPYFLPRKTLEVIEVIDLRLFFRNTNIWNLFSSLWYCGCGEWRAPHSLGCGSHICGLGFHPLVCNAPWSPHCTAGGKWHTAVAPKVPECCQVCGRCMWIVQVIELTLTGLQSRHLLPLSHFVVSRVVFFFFLTFSFWATPSSTWGTMYSASWPHAWQAPELLYYFLGPFKIMAF